MKCGNTLPAALQKDAPPIHFAAVRNAGPAKFGFGDARLRAHTDGNDLDRTVAVGVTVGLVVTLRESQWRPRAGPRNRQFVALARVPHIGESLQFRTWFLRARRPLHGNKRVFDVG